MDFCTPLLHCLCMEGVHSLLKVVAVTYHLGNRILQGHYRTVLFEDGPPMHHHTEDGKKTLKFKLRDLRMVLRNAYIIYAVKSS